ncbi:MAG: 2-amino-4-hydroxy-6-hydroxymethyldihydropteridine diphosphokinase [Spirochaetota bacterium]
MVTVYIGLGSNLGDREFFISEAKKRVQRLPGTVILSESDIEETKAVGHTAQPDFLNMVIKIETGLSPHHLLDMLLAIEDELGRTRDIPLGPRTVDCDILLYGEMVIQDNRLTVPHGEIKNRPFILRQLIEVDADLRDPVTNEYYREVLKNG